MLGTVSAAALPPFVRELTPPSCVLGAPTRDAADWTHLTVVAASTDTGSGVATVKVLVDGVAQGVASGLSTPVGQMFMRTQSIRSTVGTHTLKAQCTESAGQHRPVDAGDGEAQPAAVLLADRGARPFELGPGLDDLERELAGVPTRSGRRPRRTWSR